MNFFDSFTLAPMSAGDIIDRAVRIYRRNFLALLRIVIGPSLVAYTGLILYYIGVRNFSLARGDQRVVLTTLMILVGGGMWLLGKAAFYAVLGGASQSLVDHFFDGKPILARNVYRAVRERWGAILGAIVMVAMLLMGFGAMIYFIAIVAVLVYTVLLFPLLIGLSFWPQLIINSVLGGLFVVGMLSVFLLIYSRVVYVPQVLMVERKGVFAAISRSFVLAGGEVRRIGALVVFWFYVAWSVWWLLLLPLIWYGYLQGIDMSPFNMSVPLWFNIAYQTLTQISEILIAPIAMLGFTLLYLDSRVRKEGYDVELLANRVLAAPPQIISPQPNFAISSLNATATSETAFAFGEEDEFTVNTRQAEMIRAANSMTDDQPDKTLRENDVQQRVCQYCETNANADDRFCRVCGSVF